MLLKFNSLNRRRPPPPSIVFDAGTLASVFQKLNSFLSKFEGSSTPQLEHVGSARRSSTVGPSDEARPNPLTQVSDSVPQGPDAAPGPSKAIVPLLPRVLAMLLPKDLANSLPLV